MRRRSGVLAALVVGSVALATFGGEPTSSEGDVTLVTSSAPPTATSTPDPSDAASLTDPSGADGLAAPVVVRDALGPLDGAWATATGPEAAGSEAAYLPDEVYAAYALAVASAPARCHLTTSVLAAIGQVESGNLVGRTLDDHSRPVPAILGPVLDGTRWRAVPDTDGGRWDGDTVWDRAVGPLQFIPATWRVAGVDMDGDGKRDPQDVYDAAGAAMVYLCADGRDLSTAEDLRSAVLSFNHSTAYLALVLRWKVVFEEGAARAATWAELPQWQPPAGVQTTSVADSTNSTGTSAKAGGSRPSETSGKGATAGVLPGLVTPTKPLGTPSGSPSTAAPPALSPSAPAPTAAPPSRTSPPSPSEPAPSGRALRAAPSGPAPSEPAPSESGAPPAGSPSDTPSPLPFCPTPTPTALPSDAPIPTPTPSPSPGPELVTPTTDPTLLDPDATCIPVPTPTPSPTTPVG